jgi:hypothetical protein
VSNTPLIALDEIYAAIRTSLRLTGTVASSDLIEGEVDAAIDQSVIGCRQANGTACDSFIVNAVRQNTGQPLATRDDKPSTFKAVRVRSGMDCGSLKADAASLF